MNPKKRVMIDRRTILTGAAALTATGAMQMRESHAQAVPNSVGTEPPKLKAPANAAAVVTNYVKVTFRFIGNRQFPTWDERWLHLSFVVSA